MSDSEMRAAQRLLCERFKCAPRFVVGQDRLGAARSLFADDWPVQGIRHNPAGGTSGWYLWAGKYSELPNFFESQHVEHVVDARPPLGQYLGLPPGWGFILAPGYEDVWQDDRLLID